MRFSVSAQCGRLIVNIFTPYMEHAWSRSFYWHTLSGSGNPLVQSYFLPQPPSLFHSSLIHPPASLTHYYVIPRYPRPWLQALVSWLVRCFVSISYHVHSHSTGMRFWWRYMACAKDAGGVPFRVARSCDTDGEWEIVVSTHNQIPGCPHAIQFFLRRY